MKTTSGIASTQIICVILAGCQSTAPVLTYTPPQNVPLADLEIWVDHFRNNANITFEYSTGEMLPEAKGALFLGKLESGGLFAEEVTRLNLAVPAQDPFFLYFRYKSASGYVTKSCFAVVELSLSENQSYRLEFVNWKPKEATFANFTCELDFGQVNEDGSVSPIEYFYVPTN